MTARFVPRGDGVAGEHVEVAVGVQHRQRLAHATTVIKQSVSDRTVSPPALQAR